MANLFLSVAASASEKPVIHEKILFGFEEDNASKNWETTEGGEIDVVSGPAQKSDSNDSPSGKALHVRLPKNGVLKAKSSVIPNEWTNYSDISFWVYREVAVAKNQQKVAADIRLRVKDGKGYYWRQIEINHSGWKRVSVPLRWFRLGDSRVPGWENVSHLEIIFNDRADLIIDTILVRSERKSGPLVTSDDLQEVAFPGVAEGKVRSAINPDIWIMTNEPDLDLAVLTKHLQLVAARVTKDLSLPKIQEGRCPVLVVFASRQQFQSYPVHLAVKLNAEPILPRSAGFTTDAIGTSYWDPIAREKRPAFTHEFVHSLVERTLGINCRGDWLHEALANHYQLQFHPQPGLAEVVRAGFKKSGIPFSRLCNGMMVSSEHYWRLATLGEMLLTDEKYKSKIPALLAALSQAETTALQPHLENILKCTWDDLERDWKLHCAKQYDAAPDGVPAKDRPVLPPDVEVHGVGLYQPRWDGFSLREVIDWKTFAEVLRESTKTKKGLAWRIWSRLPEEARSVLQDADKSAAVGKRSLQINSDLFKEILKDRRTVSDGFLLVLNDKTFYSPKEIEGLETSKQVQELFLKGPLRTKLDTRLMNRLVLKTVCPKVFRTEPDDPSEVVVEVKTNKPIVLVLTAYHSCNWVVKPGLDAKIAWVIVSGYYQQQVSGVTCPVATVGRYEKSGDYFAGSLSVHDKSSKDFDSYQKKIRELTSHEISSFQGYESYGGVPINVPRK